MRKKTNGLLNGFRKTNAVCSQKTEVIYNAAM